jgi:hypothetical protein
LEARLKKRDGVGHTGQATTSEAESVVGGGWELLAPDDIPGFEGEGELAVREPVSPEPPEIIDAAQSSAAKKSKAMNARS